jgi:hypothetical protein
MESANEEVSYMKEVDKLNCLKLQIEKLEQSKQIEILRIIVNAQKISINENQYGIHINLTDLPKDVITELQIYINYIKKQEEELINGELKKKDYETTYFHKGNKELLPI